MAPMAIAIGTAMVIGDVCAISAIRSIAINTIFVTISANCENSKSL